MSTPFSNSKKIPPTVRVKNYTLIERIGSGSYSTVYRAYKDNTKENVAIKCIEKSKLSSSGVENIITEITMMKLLHCDYIIEMKDFQWDERHIYIILEFCDGGDLSNFIKSKRRITEVIFRMFMRQLALGLQFLRSHKICHLDLKPQNLLLKHQPVLTLKIADFGLAKFLLDDVHQTSVRGSPLYMAPEMLLKQKYDSKADLWSVGVIAYECLFGRPPFPFKSCQELINAMKVALPIQIPEEYISKECHDLLACLLVFDPGKRIEFVDFFKHPFLDLEHYPCDESYKKAIQLVHEAISLDKNKVYKDAFDKYCEALLYLIPYAKSLPENVRKRTYLLKVEEYKRRAAEIKGFLCPDEKLTLKKELMLLLPNEDDISKSLVSLSASTPSMSSAVEIGFSAQMYLVQGDYEMALKKYEASLGILIPLLSTEPPGIRKEVLSKQIQKWLAHAENIKALSLEENTRSLVPNDQQESCVIQ